MDNDTIVFMSTIIFKGIKTNYCVSSSGNVFRKRPGKPLKKLKQRTDGDGYKRVTIYVNSKPYERGVHRLVAKAFIKNPENKPEVNHKDGNKSNNDISNLEWVTVKENIRHAWDNNLAVAKKGEEHPNSIYTNDQIHQVCKLIEENKFTMKQISEKTKVSYSVVKQIKSHFLWNEISKYYDFTKYNKSRKSSSISEADVIKICKYLCKHKSISFISEKIKIKESVIESIRDRKTWTRITKDYNWDKII